MFHHDKLEPVSWYEGMLLKPQHLYQQMHFLENLISFPITYLKQSFGLLDHPNFKRNVEVDNCPADTKVSVSGFLGITKNGEWISVPPGQKIVRSQKLEKKNYLISLRVNNENRFSYQPQENISSRYDLVFLESAKEVREEDLLIAEILCKNEEFFLNEKYVPPCFYLSCHTEILSIFDKVKQNFARLYRSLFEKIKNERDSNFVAYFLPVLVSIIPQLYCSHPNQLSPKSFLGTLLQFFQTIYIFFCLDSSPFRNRAEELEKCIKDMELFLQERNCGDRVDSIFLQIESILENIINDFSQYYGAKEPPETLTCNGKTFRRVMVNNNATFIIGQLCTHAFSSFASPINRNDVIIVFQMRYSNSYTLLCESNIRAGYNQYQNLYANTVEVPTINKMNEEQLGARNYFGIYLNYANTPATIENIGVTLPKEITLSHFIVYVEQNRR